MDRTIFFINKQITFSPSPRAGYDLTIDSRADTIATISRAKVMSFFEKYNSVLFLCNTTDEAYEQFCREFRSIKAAGGVVRNSRGECLMILRNGRWDLPKGHLERGESLEQCALREVEEETGITGLTLGEKLLETHHAYVLNEEWAIKTTTWYSMHSDSLETQPQSEEGIELVAWCTEEQVQENLKGSFASIRAVFSLS